MLYRIAALIRGRYVWVSDYVTREQALPHLYSLLHTAYTDEMLKTFEGYDEAQIAVAFLTASAYEQEKARKREHLDTEQGRTLKGEGGDHDEVYSYSPPFWGKQESMWCRLLGEVVRGEWGNLKNRIILKTRR